MGKITQDKIKRGKNNPEITQRITMNFNTGPQCNSDGLCNVDDYVNLLTINCSDRKPLRRGTTLTS
jgi:hypothetical protein